MKRVVPDLNAFCSPTSIFLALKALLSLIADRQDKASSKRAANISLHAIDRPAVKEDASSIKPASSNEGSEKPSQQPQQQPQSSRQAPEGASEPAKTRRSSGRPKAAGSSDSTAEPKQSDRPPGMIAPTSEKYPANSVHYSLLQLIWK